MTAKFDYFAVFAEMRTGSNFLEANINAFDDLTCHGEAFNALFIGYPKSDNILGVTKDARDADPQMLIDAIKADDGLAGFRIFHDHDPRAIAISLADPRCAKIILTRNPIDSFVSWKIAQATGQWKLTNPTKARSQQVIVDIDEFERHLEVLQDFQIHMMNTLQHTGQTAFYLSYDDLHDVDTMNGLATYLGADARITSINKKLKKQNPAPMIDKVANFDQLEKSLARLDRFNLNRTPNFEPRRGPMIPGFVAAPESGLLYMPLRSGPDSAVCQWLAAVDGKETADLQTRFTQKTLRAWKKDRLGHRSFAVLRHPIARAHSAFCDRILPTGPGSFPEIREKLCKVHKLQIPDPDDINAHRKAFLTFLVFLRANLAAQTNVRVDPAWTSQLTILQGMATFAVPDILIREATMQQDLQFLAGQIGQNNAPTVASVTDPHAARLAAIYDEQVEAAGRHACHHDYTAFGFDDWA